MAENPIVVSDIIDEQGIVSALKNVEANVNSLKEALKIKAKDIKISINGGADASGLASQISAIVDAMGRLKEFSSANTEMLKAYAEAQRAATEATRSRKKHNDDYYASLRKIDKEERELDKIREATINTEKLLNGEIDVTKLSYNQLSAIYSAMSSKLKGMSQEQIQASSEMQKFAAVTRQVRDGMNEAQKSMGNYTLNVGRYHTAFDQLGFSIQQVLREVPSSINISQFFLAISNNIPQVADNIVAFRKEQEKVKEDMKGMKQGTLEFAKAQEFVSMTIGKKFLKSIFSWQTAILAVLMLLRKLPSMMKDITEKVMRLMGETMSKTIALKNINDEAAKSVGNLTSKYKMLQKEWNDLSDSEKSGWVKEHKDALKELNIEMKNVNDAEDVFNNNTDNVVKAIRDRARSIAGMKLASELYEKAFRKQVELENLMQTELGRQRAAASSTNSFNQEGQFSTSYGGGIQFDEDKWIEETKKANKAEVDKILKEADQYISFTIGDPTDNKTPKSDKTKQPPSYKEYELMLKERNEALANLAESSYDYAIKSLEANMENEQIDLMNKFADNLAKMMENDANGKNGVLNREATINGTRVKMSEKTYNDLLILQENYNLAVNSLDNKYKLMRDSINEKWVEKYDKERTEETRKELREIKLREEYYKGSTLRRIKSSNDEIKNNQIINEEVAKLNSKLAELNELKKKPTTEDGIAMLDAEIKKTTEDIEKMNQKLSWSKQLANYKNMGDLLGGKGILEGLAGGDKRGFLGALGLDMTGASGEQIDSAFEEWMQNASDALVKWKDITIDNLGQMLDAYVEFYQAKADAASDDTDKAKEAYEMQKSLLEQGYANSVNTAWAEYQQKQEIQKKAEEDAKRAQQVQKLADEAQNFSNLVLATSNILKDYSTRPLLAAGLLATMWSTYGTAKVMALKESKYEHGGYEELTGGSHASGHDINLGVMNGKGRSMVAEGGESIGIFSRKAKRKYGSQTIGDLVNSINNGTYEKVSAERLNNNVSISVKPQIASKVSLNTIENGIGELVKSSRSSSYVDGNGNYVVVKGNSKTTYIKR